ncbi:inorganic diphosphatase [Pedobacter sp. GR22-6]|uniref:inorganic diphosphatase n=1 Tax=Pedobacter sp. GR22-6 TaxID=3127957 RepID=UPI00307F6453
MAAIRHYTVIIETPKGKGAKFDFDAALGLFKLKKVMPAGLVFPFDFGFIPGTRGGDGDPLDVLVISEMETFSGCAIDCRIIGALKVSQQERNGERMRNDRLIAVPLVSSQYAEIDSIKALPKELLSQIESFFIAYNQQAGKKFEVLGRLGINAALALIEKAKVLDEPSLLVQLLLPLQDRDGKGFPDAFYEKFQHQLTEKFGGLTVYQRNPAEGFWKEGRSETVKEAMLVHEVLVGTIDEAYWKNLKASLLKQFRQDDILITSIRISKI